MLWLRTQASGGMGSQAQASWRNAREQTRRQAARSYQARMPGQFWPPFSSLPIFRQLACFVCTSGAATRHFVQVLVRKLLDCQRALAEQAQGLDQVLKRRRDKRWIARGIKKHTSACGRWRGRCQAGQAARAPRALQQHSGGKAATARQAPPQRTCTCWTSAAMAAAGVGQRLNSSHITLRTWGGGGGGGQDGWRR